MKVFIAVAVISFLSTGVNAAPVGSCALQSPCLKWSMEKDTVCGSSDSCNVKVCMTVDTDSELCTKAGATVSHVCNKGDEDGCVTSTWTIQENVTPGEKFCQVGVPLQTLSFIAKDGADKLSDGGANPTSYTIPVCGTDGEVTCQQVAKATGIKACGGGKNNLMERVWKFTIPEDVCTCFDEVAYEEEELADGLVKLIVSYNGGSTTLPYFYANVDINGDGTTETLNTYCISTNTTIYSSPKAYCTDMIPYYDTETLGQLTGVIDELDLDLVTCILNNFKPTDVMADKKPLTRGSIQQAIWRIMGTGPGNGTEGPYSEAHIAQILAFADTDTCDGYKPPCDGVVGVVLYPYDCYKATTGCADCNPTPTSNVQPLIAQAQIATLDNVCSGYCDVCFPPSTRRMLAGKVVEKKPHWLRG